MHQSAIRLRWQLDLRLACGDRGARDNAQRRSRPSKSPFEFVHNQIVVQVKIAGKGPFNMLVDTNTDPSAIDEKTARELGLSIGSSGAPASGSAPK
jgi:hypothetical protein